VPTVPLRILDLWIDPHDAAGRPVQPANQLELFLERRDAEQPRVYRKACRILRRRYAGPSPLEYRERFELGQVEVDDVVPTVFALTARKLDGHVADVIEVEVVQNDELRVARCDDVLL
jgi:hypothetical protein